MGSVITNEGFTYLIQKAFGGDGSVTSNSENVPNLFEFGVNTATAAVSDTTCAGRVPYTYTVAESCDAVAGWANTNDADAEVLNTTSGEYIEGSGCLNLPMTYNTGTGEWTKTLAAGVNLTTGSRDVTIGYYIDDTSNLASGSDTITIWLGTGGVVNSNEYYFAKTSLTAGVWNTLRIPYGTTADNTNGTGLDQTNWDTFVIEVNITGSISGNSQRIDQITWATDANHEKSPEAGYPTHNSATNTVKHQVILSTAQANGFILARTFLKNDSDSGFISADHTTFTKSNSKELRYFFIQTYRNG